MRIKLSAGVILSLFLAGCTSNTSVDALDVARTSAETTGSIAPARLPKADVAALINAAGDDLPATEAVEPQAFVARPENKAVKAAFARPRVTAYPAEMPRHRVYGPRFRDAKPIKFARTSPMAYRVHGVDVSRWQGKIDWVKLRQRGANFAYIKATDGGDHLDPAFRRNWEAADAAGIKRGAYHFFYWCRTAGEQAKWFIRNVPKEKGALPPVIDVEWNNDSKTCRTRPSRETVIKKMTVFMDLVEAHYGQKPIIYTAPDFYDDNLKGAFKTHSFWLRSVAAHPAKVYPGRGWDFWQYSGTGLAHGVSSQIDLNVFNGDEAHWQRWLQGRVH